VARAEKDFGSGFSGNCHLIKCKKPNKYADLHVC
jgi:hypothetical protein